MTDDDVLPHVRDVNEGGHVLVMDEVGASPTPGRWLHAREEPAVAIDI